MSKRSEKIDNAVALIESAANGMSGAAMMADAAYAAGRRTEIRAALADLSGTGIDTAALAAKADRLMECCRRGQVHQAVQLNIEIGEILAPLCD